jgi:long-subunit fatty acid transport protein
LHRNFNAGLRSVESGPAISATRTSQNPDFASLTYPLKFGIWKIVPQVSYRRAVKSNFSGTTNQPYEYSESTGFRETGSDVLRFDGDRGVDVYSGAVGISVHPMVAVGAAINVFRGRSSGADTRSISATYSFAASSGPLNPSSYSTAYDAALDGTNVDIGVLVKPFRRLHIGAIVKNNFTVTRAYDYRRQYTNWPGNVTSAVYSETGTIDWPLSAGVGIAVMPVDAITVSTDYTRARWSKATYSFTSLDMQTIGGKSTTLEASGVVIYPEMYDPAAPVQAYFNVPQRDSSQLRAGAEYMWHRWPRAFTGIPLRAGAYRNQSYRPESSGKARVGVGLTAGAGVLWRQFTVDVAYVHESIRGKTREFPTTAFSGFSTSQEQGGRERTVLGQFLFSVTAGF